jgi:ligand-binding sensor domain-containing protein
VIGVGSRVGGYTGLTVSGSTRTLAVNATNAYFVSTVASVVTLSEAPIAGGGTKTPLATGGIAAIAADAAGVYWVDSTAGAVFEVATGTTTVTRLASSQTIQTMPGTIAVDAAGVYWATTTAIMALAR